MYGVKNVNFQSAVTWNNFIKNIKEGDLLNKSKRFELLMQLRYCSLKLSTKKFSRVKKRFSL